MKNWNRSLIAGVTLALALGAPALAAPPDSWITTKVKMTLLTTDGVHEYLDERRIQELIGEAPSLADVPHALVRSALARGSRDNCTAVVGEYVEPGFVETGFAGPGFSRASDDLYDHSV